MLLYFIYCDDCVDCQNMERIVIDSLQDMDIKHTISKFNCETDEALDIALEYDVTDVPACIFLNDDKTKHKAYSGPRSCQKKDVEWAVEYIRGS